MDDGELFVQDAGAIESTVRVGIVGTGGMAERFLEVLRRKSGVEVVGQVSRSPERAVAAASRWGGRPYTDADAMYDAERPDVVFIVTEPDRHEAQVTAALQRGIAVHLEKPGTPDRESALRLGRVAESADVAVQIGLHWRTWLEPVEAYLEGRTVDSVHMRWHGATPNAAWWRDRSRSGGQVNEQAIHVIDAGLRLAGGAQVVSATSTGGDPADVPTDRRSDVDRAVSATLRFDSGAVGSFSANRISPAPSDARVELSGAGFSVTLDLNGYMIADEQGTRRFEHNQARATETEVDAILRAVRTGDRNAVICTYEDGLRSQLLCNDIQEKADRSRASVTRDSVKWRSVHILAPREVAVVDEPPQPSPGPDHVLFRTVFCGISAGTDLTWYRGDSPFLTRKFNPELRLFEDGAGVTYPITNFGYERVDELIYDPRGQLRPGSLWARKSGYHTAEWADPATFNDAATFAMEIPDDIDPVTGIWLAQMGPVCVNGVLHAADMVHGRLLPNLDNTLTGERVSVTGGGIVGIVHALVARLAGASQIALVDIDEDRLRLAKDVFGLIPVNARHGSPARQLKERIYPHRDPDLCGADMAMQCTGSPDALGESIASVRRQGRVMDAGFYTSGAPNLRLGEAFHHNGVEHTCGQVGKVPRRQEPHWDRARLANVMLQLLRGPDGANITKHLITHVVPFDQAPEPLAALDQGRADMMQVVLAQPHRVSEPLMAALPLTRDRTPTPSALPPSLPVSPVPGVRRTAVDQSAAVNAKLS